MLWCHSESTSPGSELLGRFLLFYVKLLPPIQDWMSIEIIWASIVAVAIAFSAFYALLAMAAAATYRRSTV